MDPHDGQPPQVLIHNRHGTEMPLANFVFKVQHSGHSSWQCRCPKPCTPHQCAAKEDDVDISMGERCGAIYEDQPGMSVTEEDPTWTPTMVMTNEKEAEDIALTRKWIERVTKPSSAETSAASRIGKIYAGLSDSLKIDKQGVVRYLQETTIPDGPNNVKRLVLVPKSLGNQAISKAHLASPTWGCWQP